MWIGIQHAPVKIAFTIQLLDTATTLAHLFFLAFFQADTRLFAYAISPFAGKQRLDYYKIFRIITHHIPVFREFGNLFIKDIIIRLHLRMSEIIARRVHLVTRILGMRQFENLFSQRDRITGFVQSRFPKNDRWMVPVTTDHLAPDLIQTFNKGGIRIIELPSGNTLHH